VIANAAKPSTVSSFHAMGKTAHVVLVSRKYQPNKPLLGFERWGGIIGEIVGFAGFGLKTSLRAPVSLSKITLPWWWLHGYAIKLLHDLTHFQLDS